jgi:hypothetical protein
VEDVDYSGLPIHLVDDSEISDSQAVGAGDSPQRLDVASAERIGFEGTKSPIEAGGGVSGGSFVVAPSPP